MEIYTIDSVESLISNTDLVFDLKGEMKLKTIEKHSLSVFEEDLEDEFDRFIDAEKQKQLEEICTESYL